MEQKHTKSKIEITGWAEHSCCFDYRIEGDDLACECHGEPEDINRLAASWNACVNAGITTEALEAGVVSEMVEALKDAHALLVTLFGYMAVPKSVNSVLAKIGIKD